MRAKHRIVDGVASLTALAALVFGVPFALWQLAGWPLPHGIPSLHELREALSANDVPDSVIVKALALVGWCAWLMLIVCIAVETIAWMRGRAAREVRGAGALQPLVRKLVATAALLVGSNLHVPSVGGPPALATAAVAAAAHASDGRVATPSPLASIAATQPTTAAQAQVAVAANPIYTVQRHDTLWALAETHLGDPFRWREIYDLSRTTVQPGGRRLDDPNLIYPGWMLTFPPDATGFGPPPPPQPPEPSAASGPVIAPPSAPPPVAATNGSCPAPAPVAANDAANQGRSDSVGRPASERQNDTADEDSVSVPVRLVGSTLLAAALVALLTRLRIVRRRNRALGAKAARRSPHPRAETLLRREAKTDNADHLDIALRTLARSTSGSPLPRILAARLADDTVEVLLDEPLERPPRSFVDTGLRRTWKTQAAANWNALDRHARDTVHPAPALVHVGNRGADEYLIDLETAGVLSIGGDREQCVAFLEHLLNQVTAPGANQHVDLMVVGKELHSLAGDENVRRYDTLRDAATDVEQIAQVTTRALDTAGCATTFEARQSDPTDTWAPTLLLCADEPDPEGLRLLPSLHSGRGIAAVVVVAAPVSEWHIHLDRVTMQLQPLGLELEPVGLGASTMTELQDLVEESTALEALAVDQAAAATETPVHSPRTRPVATNEAEVEVRVLGPVDIVGIERIDRRRSVELITYLACHHDGVSDERLKTVLWPDAVPPHGTFHTQVSMARSKLGIGADGELRLPHISTRGGRYRVSDAVITDLEILEARVEQAKDSNNLDGVALLRDALERVRGQPFSARAGYEWAHTEGLVSHAEVLVADTAHRLSQLCLELGDPEGAQWAALQGLKAAPADELLYRDRMLAHDLAGNRGGVESVIHELCEVLESLEPYDSLQAATIELYARLTGRAAASRRDGS